MARRGSFEFFTEVTFFTEFTKCEIQGPENGLDAAYLIMEESASPLNRLNQD